MNSNGIYKVVYFTPHSPQELVHLHRLLIHLPGLLLQLPALRAGLIHLADAGLVLVEGHSLLVPGLEVLQALLLQLFADLLSLRGPAEEELLVLRGLFLIEGLDQGHVFLCKGDLADLITPNSIFANNITFLII